MRYVIIRDDDTNAFTPVSCLERLYRPFLDRGLPVNLAVIPDVATDTRQADGQPEGYLMKKGAASARTVPIGTHTKLVHYLRDNPGFHLLQHGCHHDYLEFDCPSRPEIARRLEHGSQLLQEAGFHSPETFVAPYDKLSRPALAEVASRFRILSTGWFELPRLPYGWWPKYAVKKLLQAPHWRVGRTLLLSHPGCILSYHHTYATMLGGILHYLQNQQLTVLVTHWWEYYHNNAADEEFIGFLHETASYIATHPDLKVISFSDLLQGNVRLN
jgi:hypothetical protein